MDERLKRETCFRRGGNRYVREEGGEIKMYHRVSNLFEGRRSAKKKLKLDEIETKDVFRLGAKLLCCSIEGGKIKLYRSFQSC